MAIKRRLQYPFTRNLCGGLRKDEKQDSQLPTIRDSIWNNHGKAGITIKPNRPGSVQRNHGNRDRGDRLRVGVIRAQAELLRNHLRGGVKTIEPPNGLIEDHGKTQDPRMFNGEEEMEPISKGRPHIVKYPNQQRRVTVGG